MTLAVVNNKGGVGKTTTSVNLAAALASPRRRVLLVDLDSQASASRCFGVDRAHLKPSSANCLLQTYPARQAIRATAVPGLDLITGSPDLANADVALSDVAGRELVLRQALQSVRSRYDLILIDTSPLSLAEKGTIDPIVIAGQAGASILVTTPRSLERLSLIHI